MKKGCPLGCPFLKGGKLMGEKEEFMIEIESVNKEIQEDRMKKFAEVFQQKMEEENHEL